MEVEKLGKKLLLIFGERGQTGLTFGEGVKGVRARVRRTGIRDGIALFIECLPPQRIGMGDTGRCDFRVVREGQVVRVTKSPKGLQSAHKDRNDCCFGGFIEVVSKRSNETL